MTIFSAQSAEKNYIDLHTYGFGYIQNFRLVTPKKGKPFYSCRIHALRGPRDNVNYTVFDTIITNKKAVELLTQCGDAAKEKGKRILVAFTIGDVYPESYPYHSGPKQGQTGCWEKGRLINIRMLKLDGNKIYPESTEAGRFVDDTTVETFEITTRGIGYVNKFYTYTSPDGELLKMCNISALRGSKENIEYTYFSTRVYDENTIELLEKCEDALGLRQSVFISFNIKDLCPRIFEYTGEKQGQTGCNNQGCLSRISMIKIDGYQVYPELQRPIPETPAPAAPRKPRTSKAVSIPQPAMV